MTLRFSHASWLTLNWTSKAFYNVSWAKNTTGFWVPSPQNFVNKLHSHHMSHPVRFGASPCSVPVRQHPLEKGLVLKSGNEAGCQITYISINTSQFSLIPIIFLYLRYCPMWLHFLELQNYTNYSHNPHLCRGVRFLAVLLLMLPWFTYSS